MEVLEKEPSKSHVPEVTAHRLSMSTTEKGDANENTDTLMRSGNSDEAKDTNEEQSVTGFKLFALLGSLILAAFLILLDASIIGVVGGNPSFSKISTNRTTQAIPNITSQFHSLNDVGWYTAAYQLASAAAQPLSGKIYTAFSTKVRCPFDSHNGYTNK